MAATLPLFEALAADARLSWPLSRRRSIRLDIASAPRSRRGGQPATDLLRYFH